jgi:hypothetical protein
MQILANALPGLRDVRAPVVAGYLWLLFGWLLVRPDVSKRPHNEIAAALYDLANNVGKVGTALAISVAAYLIGSVSEDLTNGIPRFWSKLHEASWLAKIAPKRIRAHLAAPTEPDRESALAPIRQLYEDALEALDRESLEGQTYDAVRDDLEERLVRTSRGTLRELELPATLLVGDQSELFSEVDRLRAEGQFRLAAALPLTAITILLALAASPVWLLALPGAAVLARQGARRASDSRRIIADAMTSGRIESSSIGRFERWVNDIDKVASRAIEVLDEEAERQEQLESRQWPEQSGN